MTRVAEVGSERVLSGFGPHPNSSERSDVAIHIPTDGVKMFAEKLARGFTWDRLRQVLSPEFEFRTWNPNATQQNEIFEIVSGLFRDAPAGIDVISLPPALTVYRVAEPADPLPAFFIFEIWSATWKLFVEVKRRESAADPA